MKTTNNKKTNEINIYGVDTILKVAKMFENDGAKFTSIQIKKTDKKFYKGELDLHGSDIFDNDATVIAFVTRNDETKYHSQWYKLTGYNESNIDNWKLVSERIEYKS